MMGLFGKIAGWFRGRPEESAGPAPARRAPTAPDAGAEPAPEAPKPEGADILRRVAGFRTPTPAGEPPDSALNELLHIVENRLQNESFELPMLPQATLQVLDFLADPKVDVVNITRMISRDQVLATSTLKMVNSAFYRGEKEITDLRQAVVRIGLYQLKLLMLTISAHTIILQGKGVTPLARRLWEHSVGCAVFGQRLAMYLTLEDESASFVAGLLHDIGKVVVLEIIRDVSWEMERKLPVDHVLTRLFDGHHERIGGIIGRAWKLPEATVTVITGHHKAPAGPHACAVAMMILTNQMCRTGDDAAPLIATGALAAAGLTEDSLRVFLKDFADMTAEIAHRLEM
ncbi:MAG: HDOD domain-containing protein [Planctomycetota bacterium]